MLIKCIIVFLCFDLLTLQQELRYGRAIRCEWVMEPIEKWLHDLQPFVIGWVPGPSSRKAVIIERRSIGPKEGRLGWEAAVNMRLWPSKLPYATTVLLLDTQMVGKQLTNLSHQSEDATQSVCMKNQWASKMVENSHRSGSQLRLVAQCPCIHKTVFIHLVEMICWLLGKHFNYIFNCYYHGDDFGDVYNSEETSVMITF